MPCLRKIMSNVEITVIRQTNGAIAQLGERLLCTQEVSGSIPLSSTIHCLKIQRINNNFRVY